ncbi:MAG: ABC transporter substrate-binding protein [Propionibacteriales bacterium]|nr:ABC transporter substrate-binding protein [Propionibacteriales bacterium]
MLPLEPTIHSRPAEVAGGVGLPTTGTFRLESGMTRFWALVAALMLAVTACGGDGSGDAEEGEEGGGSIRVALGDIESVETLALFIAMERVRERGTDVELIELADEDLANQAVVSGQADVGLGAPYALIEGSDAPLRIFCQLQAARFFVVADESEYPDWQSMDGETFTVHSRGSTTEALARIVEQEEGIEFGKISYVEGSEVRATALLRGNVKATVLDIPNRNFVMAESPGTFHELPTPDMKASDEVIFGNTEWMEANQETVQILLEEILTVWRSMVDDPAFVQEQREELGLLSDLPAELEEQLLPYYEQGAEEGLFTQDCGGEAVVQDDFVFYHEAGQLSGEPEELQVEDFWDLGPAQEAQDALAESGN